MILDWCKRNVQMIKCSQTRAFILRMGMAHQEIFKRAPCKTNSLPYKGNRIITYIIRTARHLYNKRDN